MKDMRDDKAMVVFNKWKKRKDRLARLGKPTDHDDEPDFEKLRRDAVKSLFVLPEVVRGEGGYRVD
jgi:hypothetical protein